MTKRLLAIDGGGILGLVALGALEQIEAQFRELHENPKLVLRDCFDFIGGTSTGAIIAAGLMIGKTVEELKAFYTESGKDMFSRSWLPTRQFYDNTKLSAKLKAEFSELSVAALQDRAHATDGKPWLPVDKHLLVVMNNVSTNSPWPICTNRAAMFNAPHLPDCNLNAPLWQLVRASTAAPVFFPPEIIDFGGGSVFEFEDGGVTPYNNPALQMVRMATLPTYWHHNPDAAWSLGERDMMIVSVGNSYVEYREMPKDRLFGGRFLASNLKRVPSTLMRAASVQNDTNCRLMGRATHGPDIDIELGNLLDPLDHNLDDPYGDKAFVYARYDIDMSQKNLDADPMLRHLKSTDIHLSAVNRIPDLVHIGRKNGQQVNLKEHFGEALLT